MIDSNHYGPILVTLILLSLGVPLLSASRITGHATEVGGVEVSTTTAFLLGVFVICGLLLLFYGKPKIAKAITRKRNFKLAYSPQSDTDRLRLYIKNRLDAKESSRKITSTLLKLGWDEGVVEQAFNTLDKLKPITPKRKILGKFRLNRKQKNARAK